MRCCVRQVSRMMPHHGSIPTASMSMASACHDLCSAAWVWCRYALHVTADNSNWHTIHVMVQHDALRERCSFHTIICVYLSLSLSLSIYIYIYIYVSILSLLSLLLLLFEAGRGGGTKGLSISFNPVRTIVHSKCSV